MTPPRSDTYEGLADHVLAILHSAGAIAEPRVTPWDAFFRLSEKVHDGFTVPATSFTPLMRRLVFAIGVAARFGSIVGVGTYVGYTLAWLLRDRADAEAGPHLAKGWAVDTDEEATRIARTNCELLGHGDRLRMVAADGAAWIGANPGPIDLLYLDLDDPVRGKGGYLDVFSAALPSLAPGSLILAHDACEDRFASDLARYHAALRSCSRIAGLWILPVDACGLSVASVGR